jgi:hypothetical protein
LPGKRALGTSKFRLNLLKNLHKKKPCYQTCNLFETDLMLIARIRGRRMKSTIKKSRNTVEKRETYLLKIYRRSSRPDPSIVGTVEEITGRKKTAFKTGEELLRRLDDQAEAGRLPGRAHSNK